MHASQYEHFPLPLPYVLCVCVCTLVSRLGVSNSKPSHWNPRMCLIISFTFPPPLPAFLVPYYLRSLIMFFVITLLHFPKTISVKPQSLSPNFIPYIKFYDPSPPFQSLCFMTPFPPELVLHDPSRVLIPCRGCCDAVPLSSPARGVFRTSTRASCEGRRGEYSELLPGGGGGGVHMKGGGGGPGRGVDFMGI